MDLTGVRASFGVDPDEVTSLTYQDLQERREIIRSRFREGNEGKSRRNRRRKGSHPRPS